MTSSTIYYLNYASKQISLYVASFFYFSGMISNLLCLLIFLSMKRLKNNPPSIYLLVASIANLVLMNSSFLSRIFLPNFTIDPSSTSVVWCKMRQYFGHVSAITSLFCSTWAMVDQYLLTSHHARLRQLSSVRIAQYTVWFTLICSLLHSIPLIIYNQPNVSKSTNMTSCSLSGNLIYQSYVAYFVIPFLLGIIPTVIAIIFAILTYINVKSLHQQEMRTRIQRQITHMVSAQAIFGWIGMIAYTGQSIYNLLTVSMQKNTSYRAYENFALTITGILAYTGYVFNFYIYVAVSPSIRKRFQRWIKRFVCCSIYHNHGTMFNNRTAPIYHNRKTCGSSR
ncbi:unnamed protein product [Adineta ricciae]|uniref:G-protein coupled receptors family 1 profile domain-containing protein n=1 Tax=Adineta ricciae TaxID=249248 RepID=A0A815T504_ADIRI|nr:unnamed protein product [Adineta ricciae]CAF1500676.1 unnamed protein product [Adineta ricciae]